MCMKEWHRSRSFFESAKFGFHGIYQVFVREQNLRIQAVIGTLVVCAMLFLSIPLYQMAILILAIMLVMTLEMINTCLELFSDRVHPEYNEAIRISKDVAAGAVLFASIGACIVGILIFIPSIL